MIDSFTKFAQHDERVRAVYLHGSRANPDAPTDAFSDYDIVFVVTEIASFAKSTEWLRDFGEIAFVFESLKNENIFFGKNINDLSRFYVWGILFSDGSRADLLAEIREEAMQNKFIAGKRTVVLLDKDNCLTAPTADKYAACCAGFWWFLTDVAKAIARNQPQLAAEKLNSVTLQTLNQMLKWNNSAPLKKIPENDEITNWDTVFSVCEFFGKTARAVGDNFGFLFNERDEKIIVEYLINGYMKKAKHLNKW
ncbi:MAG: aminoglycoside 6-adenylyltransferase [Defluviitaleaceae bacterium]|nr:aminoglycoside 6-adenylyltransferase [Defluviitaleaceae bacterium]